MLSSSKQNHLRSDLIETVLHCVKKRLIYANVPSNIDNQTVSVSCPAAEIFISEKWTRPRKL